MQMIRKTASKSTVLVLAGIATALPAPAPQHAGSETTRVEIAAADSMQRKIDFLKRNATLTPADPRPTIFSQTEINAYFAQKRVNLPEGIRTVTFDLSPRLVTANTRVNFDDFTAKVHSYNPLLAIFSGVHDVEVVASANGSGGTANVYVQSATLDGVRVPRMVLELFIQKFVNPKYPSIRLDGQYKLPVRIDTVKIGDRRGTVAQK
jgi:hypothetical protein